MNLGRAKSILIIAFIGLNIFLGYNLFWPDFGRLTRVAVTAEEIRITEAMLNENNYFLETTLDRAIQTSDFLTVAPASDLQKKIEKRLIEENASITVDASSKTYSREGQVLIFDSSGLIRVLFEPGVFLAERSINLEQREIRNKVEQLLKEEQLMPEGAMFDYMEHIESEGIILHYYQIHDNLPIYSGQLEVVIDLDRLKEVRIYWLEPLVRSPVREMEIISATDALSNLVRELGPSSVPRRVKQIDLGYISWEYDAEKWEIPPVWRIVLDGQQLYFINAFTGNLEQNNIIPEQLP